MKFVSTLAVAAAFLYPTNVLGGHLPECSEYNVTDSESCEMWCGGEGMGKLEPVAGDATTMGGLHAHFLQGVECHCEHPETPVPTPGATNVTETVAPNATVAPANATDDAVAPRSGGGRQLEGHGDDDEHEACWIGHEAFPTCAEKGLGECEDGAEMTCEELCKSIAGVAGAHDHHDEDDMMRRFLEGHVDGEVHAVCAHEEMEHHDDHDSHDHRVLAEEDEEEHSSHDMEMEHHGYTMCFCGSETAGEGVMVCADEGWQCPEGKECPEESEDVTSAETSTDSAVASATIRFVVPSMLLSFFVTLM